MWNVGWCQGKNYWNTTTDEGSIGEVISLPKLQKTYKPVQSGIAPEISDALWQIRCTLYPL